MPGNVNGVNGVHCANIKSLSNNADNIRNDHEIYGSGDGTKPRNTDIAIVGMACRLPGAVYDPADLWDLVANGRSGYCEVPSSRFNADAWYHPDPSRSGSLNTKGGYFLKDDIRQFENRFFGINNKEAASMDPQQRKLLELTYECFESAGLTLEACAGANIGCYVGSFSIDHLASQTRDLECLHRYSATGLGTTILSNRISHVFDLRGPSVVLDSACSSSLYSLHVACSALLNGDCDGALVAAANLIQSPDQQILLMRAGVLSPTSQCHTFDESADGYGRGEGVGALYIKKLADALRDGDPIRAVIRGTAVNSNGKTQGISQPSAKAQEAVIRKAYAQAGNIDPKLTAYVECHGTGTQAGDPVELSALSKVFSLDRNKSNPLLVGSVKTNVGHGEAVSGISAIIKVVMAFEKDIIPPSFGVKKLNPNIPFAAMAIDVVTSSRKWPCGPKRASINSFGYGGANAHAILEAVESIVPYDHRTVSTKTRPPQESLKKSFILPISASNKAAMSARLSSIISASDDYDMVDLAYTLGTKRSHLQTRGFLVTDSQGAQWPQMGKDLMVEFPSFLRTIRELDGVLQRIPHPPDWTLEDLILAPKDVSKIHEVNRSQPVCTAIQLGLVRLLDRGAIRPSAVVGHSSGEIAAAYAAGFITAAEAILVAYYRGFAIDQSSGLGCMMAVGLGEHDAKACIDATGTQGSIVAACLNSPSSTTLSGDESAVDRLFDYCNSRGIFARKLITGGKAYHSHHMLPIGEELEQLITQAVQSLSSPKRSDPKVIMVSSVTDSIISGRPPPSYWRQNMEFPVRFCQAVEKLISTDEYHFVEIGPHSALEQPIGAIIKELGHHTDSYPYNSAMIRGKDSAVCFLNLVGSLFLHWHAIQFDKLNHVEGHKETMETTQGRLLTGLRPYRWTYDDIACSESRISREIRTRKHGEHDLLGLAVPGSDGVELVWRKVVSVNSVPWLLDYKIGKSSTLSSGAYIAMAMEAVCQAQKIMPVPGKDVFALRNVSMPNMLSLPQGEETVELFLKLWRERISAFCRSDKWYEFEITSYSDTSPKIHCSGKLSLEKVTSFEGSTRTTIPTRMMLARDTKPWYQALERKGVSYGPSFVSMKSIGICQDSSQRRANGNTTLRQTLDSGKYPESQYFVHPTTIEAGVQVALIAAASGDIHQIKASVPVFIEQCNILAPPLQSVNAMIEIEASSCCTGIQSMESAIIFRTQASKPLIEIYGLSLVSVEVEQQRHPWVERQPCLRISWKPDFTRMDKTSLTRFLNEYKSSTALECEAPSFKILCAAIELLAHKNSRMRILEMGGGCVFKSRIFMRALKSEAAVRSFRSYAIGQVDSSNNLSYDIVNDFFWAKGAKSARSKPVPTFNLIIIPEKSVANRLLKENLHLLQAYLLQGGVILFHSSPTTAQTIKQSGSITSLSEITPVYMMRDPSILAKRGSPVLLIESTHEPSHVARAIMAVTSTRRILLSDVTASNFPDKANVIVALESKDPFLTVMNADEMKSIKTIIKKSSHVVWITGSDIVGGNRPKFGLVSGLARALMVELPALRISTFAAGDITTDAEMVAKNTLSILDGVESEAFGEDLEFSLHKGLLHVSRFDYDDSLNDRFQEAMSRKVAVRPLKDCHPAKLKFGVPGVIDSLSFEQMDTELTALPSDHVKINMKAIYINSHGTDCLADGVCLDDGPCIMSYGGNVQSVGSSVSDLNEGDRVVVMAPSNIQTSQRCPRWACQELLPGESFEVTASLLVNYATAIYALENIAFLQQGQTVLIHSGASGIGLAAVVIAKAAKAEVFATVKTVEEGDLLRKELSISSDHIFSLRDSGFVKKIMAQTDGRGLDVILNSLTGDGLHDTWQLCAPFCKFVELGRREINNAGKLDMRQFSKGVTFTAFNLSNIFYCPKSENTWTGLISTVMRRFRRGEIVPIDPIKIFGPAEAAQAIQPSSQHLSTRLILSLEDQETPTKVTLAQHRTFFSPTKTYLLVGCLGGLGRSLTEYMMKQGARRFIFLGRSACDKPNAQRLVDSMVASGADVQVIRGDVTNFKDVEAAIRATRTPIGGVVQAAMGLAEALFLNMTHEAWHTGVQPKFKGTYNLHYALEGNDSDLDFFLMTSSVSGSTGFASEANYCASNSFLDAFARYRCSIGKPAVAVGLGMVSGIGFIHEDMETEARLLRKGIQALSEDEFLQIIDLALSEPSATATDGRYDPLQKSHILTGLEVFGVRELRKQGFDVLPSAFTDVRAASLAASLESEDEISVAPFTHESSSGFPRLLAEALSVKDNTSVIATIANLASEKLSNLTLISIDKISAQIPIGEYGMDSLIAADFRTWFYQTFNADVPFAELFKPDATVMGLAEFVGQAIQSVEVKD